jgi:hypothetical protein
LDAGTAAGQEVAPQPIPSLFASTPSEIAVEPEINLWDLNLWAPSGRARTFVDRETREALKSVQMIDRPNRPLHFYGNAVRRRHQREMQSSANNFR